MTRGQALDKYGYPRMLRWTQAYLRRRGFPVATAYSSATTTFNDQSKWSVKLGDDFVAFLQSRDELEVSRIPWQTQ